MIYIGSKGLKVRGFICALMRFAIMAMYLNTVPLYIVDVSAKRYV